MKQSINNKKLFQMALFTLFSSLLFVGMIGVTSAQAETLDGTVKGKIYCDIGGGNGTLGKAGFKKEPVSITTDAQTGKSDFSGTVTTPVGTFTGDGIGLGKNIKKGSFSFVGTDGAASITLLGNFVFKNGVLLKASGSFIIHNVSNPDPPFFDPCYLVGKFKTKNLTP
jgi:hypothetical protein